MKTNNNNNSDQIYTINSMPWCEPPERDIELEWDTSNRAILKMAARGDIKDSDGNSIEPVRVVWKGDGEYDVYRYTLDLFGELVEVKA